MPWRKSEAWPNGSTNRWRKVRAAWLTEHPQCETCGAQATVVDHKDGCDYTTQRYDRAYLRSMCEPCHRERTAAQALDAMSRKRQASSVIIEVDERRPDERGSRDW